MQVYGPYDTDAQVRADCDWSRDRKPVAGGHVEPNRARLLQALVEAGVLLGARDTRTVDWLAGWEDETVQVIVGLISRAHDAGARAELWTDDQVLEYLAEQGRPVTPKTWSGYVARGQAPAPARRIGRTPLWAPDTIRAWHAGRRGQDWRKNQEDDDR